MFSLLKKSKKIILILAAILMTWLGFYLLNPRSKTELPSPPVQEEAINSNKTSPSATTSSTPPENNAIPTPTPSEKPGQPVPTPAPEKNEYFEPAQTTERDQKHFQEITRQTNIQIQKQMRQEEITSLKESIQNDQALLKKIEESGSGIEDYKYIEQNLKKRIQRLKTLTQK